MAICCSLREPTDSWLVHCNVAIRGFVSTLKPVIQTFCLASPVAHAHFSCFFSATTGNLRTLLFASDARASTGTQFTYWIFLSTFRRSFLFYLEFWCKT